MRRLTVEDLEQIARLAQTYLTLGEPRGSYSFKQTDSDLYHLSRAFLQLYSDKPRRDDDPVPMEFDEV